MPVKLLVAEDDNSLCSTLKDKLGREGYDVTITNNGEEAITKLNSEAFDVLLLDIKMPKVDGFGATAF